MFTKNRERKLLFNLCVKFLDVRNAYALFCFNENYLFNVFTSDTVSFVLVFLCIVPLLTYSHMKTNRDI